MKLYQLLERAQRFPLFGIEDCQKWFSTSSRGALLVQLSHYVAEGHLQRLRRGLYLLKSEPQPHPFAIASRLKPEATISLETILSQTGIMPETSLAITAVTDKRNVHYSFPQIGSFIFRHLEPRLLFGWGIEQFGPYAVRVSTPEKALLDLLWLHQREPHPQAYLQGLRLSFSARFSWNSFRSLAREFHSPRLTELSNLLESISHH